MRAVANFTWLGNSMGAQPGVRGRKEWAGGLPQWTLIGAGDVRLDIVATAFMRPDKATELIGSWPLAAVRMTEESYARKAGPVPLGAWPAAGFESRPRTGGAAAVRVRHRPASRGAPLRAARRPSGRN